MNRSATINKLCQLCLLGLICLLAWATMGVPPAQASLHTYREQPGQITVRSRQSLRDYRDRAWQAIAFKRTQNGVLQGLYLRLVGFPGAVEIDRQRPLTLLAPTGQQWQLTEALDLQTQDLPTNVWQYDLQPLLMDVDSALPLAGQIPLVDSTAAELAIAPFIVAEWLQVKTAMVSPAPVSPSLRKET